MAENFPNMVKKTHIQAQKAQEITNKMNTPRYIIIKMLKIK